MLRGGQTTFLPNGIFNNLAATAAHDQLVAHHNGRRFKVVAHLFREEDATRLALNEIRIALGVACEDKELASLVDEAHGRGPSKGGQLCAIDDLACAAMDGSKLGPAWLWVFGIAATLADVGKDE